MTAKADEALSIALDLPPEERAAIIDKLLRSLDEPDPQIMAAWMDEAKRRMEAYVRGEIESYSEEDVLAELDRTCESDS